MDNKQKLILDKLLGDRLRQKLVAQGFSEEEFLAQMEKLGEVIGENVVLGLLTKKPPESPFSTEEEVIEHIKSNFSDEEIQQMFVEKAEIFANDYLKSTAIV